MAISASTSSNIGFLTGYGSFTPAAGYLSTLVSILEPPLLGVVLYVTNRLVVKF